MLRVELIAAPGQSGCQIEAETIHVHRLDPVPQRVQDQLDHPEVSGVQAVSAPGEVDVPTVVVQPVVGGGVQAAERQRGSGGPALRGVVVDHVEQDLQPGCVQGLDHGPELDHRVRGVVRRRVRQMRGEEPKRAVTPVVR